MADEIPYFLQLHAEREAQKKEVEKKDEQNQIKAEQSFAAARGKSEAKDVVDNKMGEARANVAAKMAEAEANVAAKSAAVAPAAEPPRRAPPSPAQMPDPEPVQQRMVR